MRRWKIKSIQEFEECIKYDVSELKSQTDIFEAYYKNKIEIPKKNGKREIYVIDKTNCLYKIQKNLQKNFLNNIMLSDRAFGFVKEQSYFDYLQEHINVLGCNQYLRIDIKDFFGSISDGHIEEAFDFYIEGDEKTQIVDTIKKIVLYNHELVQGTPVAPTISNIVFRSLDIRIERYCALQGVNYSRYADDLLFSTDREGILSRRFIRTIERILNSKDFCINYDKMRLSNKFISLNGFVVGKEIRLSRKKLKHINGMIYYLEKNTFENDKSWFKEFNQQMGMLGYDKIENIDEIVNILAGNRSFLLAAKRVGKEENYLNHCDRLINRIERQISLLME